MSIDVAVIGCGRMGAFTSPAVQRFAPACWLPLAHAEAVQAHPRLRLGALVDPQSEALARAQRHYGVAQGYADLEQMLTAFQPALATVATRTIGRAALIERLIGQGTRALHVEKPLCNSPTELAMLEKLLSRDDVYLTLGAVRRHLAPYRQARALVEADTLGALREIHVNMGEAPLFWTHPHSVDLLLFAAGAARHPVSASARLTRVEMEDGAIGSDPIVQTASLLFDDGVEGRITRLPGCDLVFGCEHGTVTVENDGHAVKVRLISGDDPYPQAQALAAVEARAPGGSLAAIDQLVQCLDGHPAAHAANRALVQDVLLGQRLLFAFVKSHLNGGRPVDPADIEGAPCVLARSGQFYA